MRTTIRLDDNLLAEAKRVAADKGTTLTALIEEALRIQLARQTSTTQRQPVSLTTFSGDGLQPGVDLDDTAAVLDMMDQPNGSP